MLSQRFALVTRTLAAMVVSLAVTWPCTGHFGGGHGGGAGHALGGYGGFRGGPYGFRGGYGYGFSRYPGFYGYPWYGFGFGLGLGYGLGYGYGYGYSYYPYVGGYPIYVNPGYGPPPGFCPVAGNGPATTGPANHAPGTPIRLTDSDMLLSIHVPPDAVVRINGEKTSQGGPRREFLSSGLSPGRRYTFVVTAQWTGPQGQAVQLEQRIQVQGGERRSVDFLTPFATRDVR
jgi:uncharacterized protein (TIGR03000 family)